jgi:hypothetical protein
MALGILLSTHRRYRSHLDDFRPRHLLLVRHIHSLHTCPVTDSASPGDVNPDAGSMNYAIVVMAGVWAFAIGFWFFPKVGGKTFFS